ncbi:hypothetical protein RQP46_000889 [Phenoliferia psychrophenolica]
MGNSSSSHSSHSGKESRQSRSPSEPVQPPTTTVDGGFIEPQSMLYASSAQEYSRPTVHRLILERRLAPFYLGLNDFEPDWNVEQIVTALEEGDRQATQNLREALGAASEAATEAEVVQLSNPPTTRKGKEAAQASATAVLHRERLAELIRFKEKRGGGLYWSSKTEQARRYVAHALECPICFLYYPPNLVHTRCCDQPICTECFVQIKRADPTTTHLESEPAACPFCMEPNFGGIYFQEKPEVSRPTMTTSNSGASGLSTVEDTPAASPAPKPRRKSFAHTEKHVVTTDQIHPDWEAKVEAVRATVARRANRRIVFRQVGDRLVPVGITSGREGDGANATMSTAALPPGFAAQVAAALDTSGSVSGGREGRRATRRRNAEMAQYLESMGVGVGQDLEELMILEAMRLSLAEDEERQKKARDAAAAGGTPDAETSAQGAARSEEERSTTPNSTTAALSDAMGAPLSLMDREQTSGTSLSRGIINAGLTGTVPARRASNAGSTTPPQIPSLVPSSPVTLPDAPPSPPSLPSSSSSPPIIPHQRDPSPSLISFSTSGSSVRSTTNGEPEGSDDDEEAPLTPLQGYQELEDDDDEEELGSAAKVHGGDDRREAVDVPTRLSSQSLVNASG